MRTSWMVMTLMACGASDPPAADEPRTYSFGPYTVADGQEITSQCVQITLHNDTVLYVNQVELTTGPGFHHSNWFFVPAGDPAHGSLGPFDGPDGTFTCADRGFDIAVAALKGGVLFAQSTQAVHDLQKFPTGAAIQIPANSKLVAQIHLLNVGDAPVMVAPTITLTPILQSALTTKLAGVSFEDHALGLPPNKQSQFTVDCDLQPQWNTLLSSGRVTAPSPDFNLYYALAHYHKLGTGMEIDQVASDDATSAMIYKTSAEIGDSLGGTLDPPVSMTGYSHIRFTCDYFNDTASTVSYGNGAGEMCIFLAFSDSPYNWGGGALDNDPAGPETDVGATATFTHACSVYAVEQSTN